MEQVRWLGEDEQRMWRAYLEATRQLNVALDRQLVRDSGIGLTDFEILVYLSEAPDGALRMWELADRLSATRGGATRAVARLEAQGWVTRTRCAEDRRGMIARLTAEGYEAVHAASRGHVEAVRSILFDGLEPGDVAVLERVFQGMLARMAQG